MLPKRFCFNVFPTFVFVRSKSVLSGAIPLIILAPSHSGEVKGRGWKVGGHRSIGEGEMRIDNLELSPGHPQGAQTGPPPGPPTRG